MPSIHVGALEPYELSILATSDDPAFDLTTIAAAWFEVEREVGEVELWVAEASEAAAVAGGTQAILRHPYAEGDLRELETLKVRPKYTLTGFDGPVYGKAFLLLVHRGRD